MNKRFALVAAALACATLSIGVAPAFSQKAAGAEAPSKPIVAMRRLTEGEYRRSIADIFGPDIKITGRFEPEVRRDGLIAIGSSQAAISSSGMEQYYAMASGISAQVTSKTARTKYLPCAPAAPAKADDVCARKIFSKLGRSLYRRPLQDSELKAFVSTARTAGTQAKDFYVGIEETLTTLLTSPNFLFRIERAAGQPADGKAVLDDYSRASRLSFAFWDAPPDEALLQAAEKGELSTKAGLNAQVDRLASSPRMADGLGAFFDDMLQMELFRTQTKDPVRFPKYSQVVAEQAREQTIRTIVDLLLTKNGDYRDIFTTNNTFMTRNLALVYKVPYTSNAAWAPYSFPNDLGRSGVLTQISFLSLFAHPAQSSPTKRGVALNEIFLCQPIPPPPPDVDFSAVNADGPNRPKTVRARLELHRQNKTCAACHAIFDPLGVTLEKFDALGQPREMEDGQKINVSSELGGEKFEGASGLGKVLHDNPQTSRCVVRNLYATGTGRSPTGVDYMAINDLVKQFVAGDYRVPAFMKTMAQSDAFFSATLPQSAPAKLASTTSSSAQKETRP